jgi:hypothetical protein
MRDWSQKFLDALAETCNVSLSCQRAGIGRTVAYDYRKQNKRFAAAWARALEIGVGSLEDEAIRRARDGTDKGIYHDGKWIATEKRYSDTLLIFLLKAHKPDVYNPPQKLEHTGKGGGVIELQWPGLPSEGE